MTIAKALGLILLLVAAVLASTFVISICDEDCPCWVAIPAGLCAGAGYCLVTI